MVESATTPLKFQMRSAQGVQVRLDQYHDCMTSVTQRSNRVATARLKQHNRAGWRQGGRAADDHNKHHGLLLAS